MEDFSPWIFSILRLFCHRSGIIKYLSYPRYFSILSGTIFRSTSEDIFNEDPVKVAERYNVTTNRRGKGKKLGRSRTTSVSISPLLYSTQAEEIVNCAPACILRARNEIQEISFIKEVPFLIIF